MASISINSLVRTLKMSQTKKRAECAISEPDLNLPGWNQKQRHDLFEGITIHGMKRLKKLQRHVGSKTHEEVRIATELYKKEVRNRELTFDMERQIEEAGVTNEDYKTWLASQSHRAEHLPIAALEALLHQIAPNFHRTTELSFPNWRRAEIKDFLATVELSDIIDDDISQHIPTKSELEITGATDAYTIICDARTHAIKRGHRIPTYDDLRPGYVYLQCVVAALGNNEKMKKLKIPRNADPNMAKAQFVLKEWLMPDVGPLQNGWTKDEKYLLIVAIETYGPFDILKIQSKLAWKTRSELKLAISAIKKEAQFKEKHYEKSIAARYVSLASWGNTLTHCTKGKQQIAAAKRLISALEELPKPPNPLSFLNLIRPDVTMEEMTAAVLNSSMENAFNSGTRLIPLLRRLIVNRQAKMCRKSAKHHCKKAQRELDTESESEPASESDTDPDEPQRKLDSKPPRNAQFMAPANQQPQAKSMLKPKSKPKNKRKPKRK